MKRNLLLFTTIIKLFVFVFAVYLTSTPSATAACPAKENCSTVYFSNGCQICCTSDDMIEGGACGSGTNTCNPGVNCTNDVICGAPDNGRHAVGFACPYYCTGTTSYSNTGYSDPNNNNSCYTCPANASANADHKGCTCNQGYEWTGSCTAIVTACTPGVNCTNDVTCGAPDNGRHAAGYTCPTAATCTGGASFTYCNTSTHRYSTTNWTQSRASNGTPGCPGYTDLGECSTNTTCQSSNPSAPNTDGATASCVSNVSACTGNTYSSTGNAPCTPCESNKTANANHTACGCFVVGESWNGTMCTAGNQACTYTCPSGDTRSSVTDSFGTCTVAADCPAACPAKPTHSAWNIGNGAYQTSCSYYCIDNYTGANCDTAPTNSCGAWSTYGSASFTGDSCRINTSRSCTITGTEYGTQSDSSCTCPFPYSGTSASVSTCYRSSSVITGNVRTRLVNGTVPSRIPSWAQTIDISILNVGNTTATINGSNYTTGNVPKATAYSVQPIWTNFYSKGLITGPSVGVSSYEYQAAGVACGGADNYDCYNYFSNPGSFAANDKSVDTGMDFTFTPNTPSVSAPNANGTYGSNIPISWSGINGTVIATWSINCPGFGSNTGTGNGSYTLNNIRNNSTCSLSGTDEWGQSFTASIQVVIGAQAAPTITSFKIATPYDTTPASSARTVNGGAASSLTLVVSNIDSNDTCNVKFNNGSSITNYPITGNQFSGGTYNWPSSQLNPFNANSSWDASCINSSGIRTATSTVNLTVIDPVTTSVTYPSTPITLGQTKTVDISTTGNSCTLYKTVSGVTNPVSGASMSSAVVNSNGTRSYKVTWTPTQTGTDGPYSVDCLDTTISWRPHIASPSFSITVNGPAATVSAAYVQSNDASPTISWNCPAPSTSYNIVRSPVWANVPSWANGTTLSSNNQDILTNNDLTTSSQTFSYTLTCKTSTGTASNDTPVATNVTVPKKITVTPPATQYNVINTDMTINWTSDGSRCRVYEWDGVTPISTDTSPVSGYIQGQTGSYSYNFNKSSRQELQSTHLTNNSPSNALGYKIKCNDQTNPARLDNTVSFTTEVYKPTVATAGNPDTNGNVVFSCASDFDWMFIEKRKPTTAAPTTIYNRVFANNQTSTQTYSVLTEPGAHYTLTCKSVGINANIDTAVYPLTSQMINGSMSAYPTLNSSTLQTDTGDTSITDTKSLTVNSANGKFEALTYEASGADTINVSLSVYNASGAATTYTGTNVPVQYRLNSANGYKILLSGSESPTYLYGAKWTVVTTASGKTGIVTKTLNLNLVSDLQPVAVIGVPVNIIDNKYRVDYKCANSISYELRSISDTGVTNVLVPNTTITSQVWPQTWTGDLLPTAANSWQIQLKCIVSPTKIATDTTDPQPNNLLLPPTFSIFSTIPPQVCGSGSPIITWKIMNSRGKNCSLSATPSSEVTSSSAYTTELARINTELGKSIFVSKSTGNTMTQAQAFEEDRSGFSYFESPKIRINNTVNFLLKCSASAVGPSTASVSRQVLFNTACTGQPSSGK